MKFTYIIKATNYTVLTEPEDTVIAKLRVAAADYVECRVLHDFVFFIFFTRNLNDFIL